MREENTRNVSRASTALTYNAPRANNAERSAADDDLRPPRRAAPANRVAPRAEALYAAANSARPPRDDMRRWRTIIGYAAKVL